MADVPGRAPYRITFYDTNRPDRQERHTAETFEEFLSILSSRRPFGATTGVRAFGEDPTAEVQDA